VGRPTRRQPAGAAVRLTTLSGATTVRLTTLSGATALPTPLSTGATALPTPLSTGATALPTPLSTGATARPTSPFTSAAGVASSLPRAGGSTHARGPLPPSEECGALRPEPTPTAGRTGRRSANTAPGTGSVADVRCVTVLPTGSPGPSFGRAKRGSGAGLLSVTVLPTGSRWPPPLWAGPASRGSGAGVRCVTVLSAGSTRPRARRRAGTPCASAPCHSCHANSLLSPRANKARTQPGTGLGRLSRRRPTLPGGRPPSTIGAGGLNFRVRDGNGCGPTAIATGNLAEVRYVVASLQSWRLLERSIASTSGDDPQAFGRLVPVG
jgi:hypothetical protein